MPRWLAAGANAQPAAATPLPAPALLRAQPPRVIAPQAAATAPRPLERAAPQPAPASSPALIPLSATRAPFASPVLSSEEKRAALEALNRDEVSGCTRCGLSHSRTHTVFGEGDPDAQLMFIGEGPGAREDQTGRPFVGPAGELLNRMIAAMGLSREKVYIANIVKCRAFHPGPARQGSRPGAG